jgi:hypothetical protein
MKEQSEKILPEKARLLEKLKMGKFTVPDFIFLEAEDFDRENFSALETFLKNHHESFKVLARSAHPEEEFYKGGTFDSLDTYADLAGIEYARKRMINFAKTTHRLSVLRQQKFNKAPTRPLTSIPTRWGSSSCPSSKAPTLWQKCWRTIGNSDTAVTEHIKSKAIPM